MHLDGARLWNAHIKQGFSFPEIGQYFDTISVCLSKGLGAPIGSVLISTKARIAESRVWRKRFGGGMRQVGIIAAAGHYALENNIARIADDHRRAEVLAERLSRVAPGAISPVDTNIILIDLTNSNTDGQAFAAAAKERSIWVSALSPKIVRLITHLDINDADVDRASEVISTLLQKAFVSK